MTLIDAVHAVCSDFDRCRSEGKTCPLYMERDLPKEERFLCDKKFDPDYYDKIRDILYNYGYTEYIVDYTSSDIDFSLSDSELDNLFS